MALPAWPAYAITDSAHPPENYVDRTTPGKDGYVVTDHKQSTLALGVTQDVYTVNMKSDKKQNKIFLATADLGRKDLTIHANISEEFDGEGKWGLATLTNQMQAAQKKHSNPDDATNYVSDFNVVAGVNAGYYNMASGEPLDAFAMEGTVYRDNRDRPYFVIRKDGTPVIGWENEEWNEMKNDEKNPIWDAVGGSDILIWDGKLVAPNGEGGSTYETTPNARAVIGIKEDGKTVVFGEVDGLKPPASRGMSMRELAEVMYNAGCKYALNLDGGGSATYVSRQADGTLQMLSNPADGYERSVSSTLYVVSTTPPTGDFDSVELTPENAYVTPGSTVKIDAAGFSSSHSPMDIPDNAVWRLASGSEGLGEVTEGQFVGNEKTGDATIEVVIDGKVFGKTTIHVVHPDKLEISNGTALSYDGKIQLKYTATYGDGIAVKTKPDDFEITLSPENMGTLDKETFTACGEELSGEVKQGDITITYRYKEGISDTLHLKFGKKSKILFDFESETDGNSAEDWIAEGFGEEWNVNGTAKVEKVNKSEGMVHDGNYALKITCDWRDIISNAGDSGWEQLFLWTKYDYPTDDKWNPWIDLPEVTSWGAWVWVPDEDTIGDIAINGYDGAQGQTILHYNTTELQGQHHDEGYWTYVHFDFTNSTGNWIECEKSLMNFMLSTQGSFKPNCYKSQNNKFVYYVDSISLDYSEATPDRDAPVFTTANVLNADGNLKEMAEKTVTAAEGDTVQFRTFVTEVDKPNKTGLEKTSAVIDGTEVPSRYFDGAIQTEAVKLAAGTHSVVFYAEDGEGNRSELKRKFETTGNSNAATIVVEPHDREADQIPIGSVYYADVKATDVSKIQKVTLTADLVNNAKWELDHADVDPKFKMSWSMDGPIDKDENYATITLERVKPYEKGDGSILASLPVRTWTQSDKYPTEFSGRDKNDEIEPGSPWGPAQAWQHELFYPVDVKLEVDKGEIEYVDGYEPDTLPVFGSEKIQVDTELYDFSENVVKDHPEKNSWHVHEASKPIEDLAPTCTSNGYKNRRVCEVCGSPVTEEDWGETVYTEGHKYEPDADGKMVCTVCGLALTGELDGKTYEDGLPVGGESGKWVGDRYYVQGKPVSAGLHLIENVWYNFDENGICEEKTPFTGFIDATDPDAVKEVTATPTYKENALRDYTFTLSGLDKDKTYKYIVGGETQTGWFDLPGDGPTKDASFHFHADENGNLHPSTHAVDTRQCARTGRYEYSCDECGATDQGAVLFFEGHKWDENHKCEVCGFQGINIAEEGKISIGKYFKYTGGEIVPTYTLYVRGKELNTRYDAYGYDGGALLSDNVDIGVATLTIEGRGDYYGEISANFTIVPESIDDRITVSQKNDTSVTLSWPQMAGADYYEVYKDNGEDEGNDNLELVYKTESGTECSYTIEGMKLGESYNYRVASRAVRDGEIYYCARWGYAKGTIEHAWGEPEEGSRDATCTEPGFLKHTCTDCGAHEEIEIPAKGHIVPEDSWTVTKEPTVDEKGEKQGKCSVCGQTVTEAIDKLPSVGSGNSTEPGVSQETVTNPDGSKTTTTVNPDGTTTETTTYPDGTVTEKNTDRSGIVTETTTKPDGTVTEKMTEKDGSSIEHTTTPEGVTGQMSSDKNGNVTSANVTIPENVESEFVTAPVKVPAAKSSKEAPAIELKVGSADVSRVEIPVEQFGPGTVAILVHEDGTEEVVRDCTIGENGVILNVEGDVTLKIVERSQNFTDVASGNWASDAVEFVAARELFQGTGNQQFTPEGNMTRGMLVTVLYRLAYEPEAAQVDFGDIDQQAYYSDAVAWAASNGVVTGYSDHAFGPDDDITREQLATILYRYAKNHTAIIGQTATLTTFADASQISPYATEAMSWAVSSGLVNGVGNNQLAPEGEATRAQVATMLMRFCEKIA